MQHTHAIEAASCTPYLHVTSPELEAGKTRFLEAIERVVPRPLWFGASVSTASVFRAVGEMHPTLLVDEADNALKDRNAKAELLGVLNIGYQRGKTVVRIGGARNDRLDIFEVFCPKVIAGLEDLPPTLASRCLRFQMRRKLPGEFVTDFFADEAEELARPLREGLAAWAEAHASRLRQVRPDRLGVRDRLEETLRPLLALADEAGEEWSKRGRAALLELAQGAVMESESSRVGLLRDIRTTFADAGSEEMTTSDLLAALFRCDECPYAQWWGDVHRDDTGNVLPDRGATMKLARMLKAFGIHSRKVGPADGRRQGYQLADFEDASSRYLRSEVGQVGQTAQPSRKQVVSSRTETLSLSDLEEPVFGSTKPFVQAVRLERVESVNEPAGDDGDDPVQDELDRCRAIAKSPPPAIGDPDFLPHLVAALEAGHITESEFHEADRAHQFVVKRRKS